MIMETFKASHVRLLQELKAKGWTVKEGLKIPYAVHPEAYRVWFKKEAVYISMGTNFGDARSMWIDSRGMSVEQFISHAESWAKL